MKLTYKDAGVDIDTSHKLVNRITQLAIQTQRKGTIGSLGGFGALFELPLDKYNHPILVSSTDGVGTKLKLAIELNQHDSIGIDLVAMCVNDIIVQGAEPLFFLDYFATGRLEFLKAESIISGLVQGCQEAQVALIGGETAEMPGVYSDKDYDLAGFVVGIVDKPKLITGQDVTPGDSLIALPSSGLHANGYSLVRKILSLKNHALNKSFAGNTLGSTLLTPTRIYVKTILKLLEEIPVKALAHITGGGIVENLPRVLPKNTEAIIDKKTWKLPSIFEWLQSEGNVEEKELFRTFNCGVGFLICMAHEHENAALTYLTHLGEKPWKIGTVNASSNEAPSVSFI
jgi:phosphoribosylformylglycinamidine cyclo-ligase